MNTAQDYLAFFPAGWQKSLHCELLRDLDWFITPHIKNHKIIRGENTDCFANNSRKLVSEVILPETQQRECIYCWQ